MRKFILALLPGLLLACGDDVVATSADTSSDTGPDPSGDPTGGDPSGSPTSDPSGSPTTVDPTTGSVSESVSEATTVGTLTTPTSDTESTATDPSASDTLTTVSDTTDGETTTTDTTTGNTGLCGADGPEVAAELIHVDEPVPPCGALEFTGQNQAMAPGPFYALDGCPCGANCIKPDPWTFSLTAPKGWEAGVLPACPRIVVERQMSKKGCELVGLAIWDAQEPEGSAPLYHAGSLLGPIQAVVGQLGIEAIAVEECDCDDCCGTPTRFDLKFSALKTEATIAEGASGQLGDGQLGYDVMNFQSHVSGICDDSPAIDWVAKRTP